MRRKPFGRGPDLLERIVADFEACGLVGEAPTSCSATWPRSAARRTSRSRC